VHFEPPTFCFWRNQNQQSCGSKSSLFITLSTLMTAQGTFWGHFTIYFHRLGSFKCLFSDAWNLKWSQEVVPFKCDTFGCLTANCFKDDFLEACSFHAKPNLLIEQAQLHDLTLCCTFFGLLWASCHRNWQSHYFACRFCLAWWNCKLFHSTLQSGDLTTDLKLGWTHQCKCNEWKSWKDGRTEGRAVLDGSKQMLWKRKKMCPVVCSSNGWKSFWPKKNESFIGGHAKSFQSNCKWKVEVTSWNMCCETERKFCWHVARHWEWNKWITLAWHSHLRHQHKLTIWLLWLLCLSCLMELQIVLQHWFQAFGHGPNKGSPLFAPRGWGLPWGNTKATTVLRRIPSCVKVAQFPV